MDRKGFGSINHTKFGRLPRTVSRDFAPRLVSFDALRPNTVSSLMRKKAATAMSEDGETAEPLPDLTV